jgi:hypothetical protein
MGKLPEVTATAASKKGQAISLVQVSQPDNKNHLNQSGSSIQQKQQSIICCLSISIDCKPAATVAKQSGTDLIKAVVAKPVWIEWRGIRCG